MVTSVTSTSMSFWEQVPTPSPTTKGEEPAQPPAIFSPLQQKKVDLIASKIPSSPLRVIPSHCASHETVPFPYLRVSLPSSETSCTDNASPDPLLPLPRYCTFNNLLERNRHEEISPRIFPSLKSVFWANRQKRKSFLLPPLNLPPQHLQLDKT